MPVKVSKSATHLGILQNVMIVDWNFCCWVLFISMLVGHICLILGGKYLSCLSLRSVFFESLFLFRGFGECVMYEQDDMVSLKYAAMKSLNWVE